MVKIWAAISAFFTAFTLSAQSSVYESPDIENISSDVIELTQQITANASTDADKVTLIYQWITGHISYDGKADRRPGAYRSPTDVLKSGKAICYGYAQLFRDMCGACNIESFVVTGYGFNGKLPGRLPIEANHAWNSVRVGGEWQLVDATWGSGLNSNAYLFPSPEKFGQSHIPSFFGWSLTPCTNSRFSYPVICGLSDSLSRYLAQGALQRAVTEAKADYLINRTNRNRHFLGQAYISRAIDLKENADLVRESSDIRDTSSISLYGQALEVFEIGDSYLDSLFGWQNESWAYAILNRASAVYNTLDKTTYSFDSLQVIVIEYEKAIILLEQVTDSFTAETAIIQSSRQLSIFEEEMRNLRN